MLETLIEDNEMRHAAELRAAEELRSEQREALQNDLNQKADDEKTQELTLRECEVAVEERKLKQGDDKLAAADANCDVSSVNSCWTNNSMSGYLAPKELCP